MAVGKAKYSLVLDENGGIVDDVIVYRLGDERFLVIANAGNREPVAEALADRVEGARGGGRRWHRRLLADRGPGSSRPRRARGD